MDRKLEILYWRIMVKGLNFTEKGIKLIEDKIITNKLRILRKLTNALRGNFTDNVALT